MDPRLLLFGVPQWVHEGSTRTLPGNKPATLLLYLACRRDWVSRDELTLLYWPESTEASARQALRQLIHRARAFDWAAGLEIEGEGLRWMVDSDHRRFATAMATGDWHGLAVSYRGGFLEGLRVPDAPAFEEWLDLERAELHRVYLEAVVKAAAALELRRSYDEAVVLLREAWRRDGLSEEVASTLMRCLALAGEREEARQVYQRFAGRLQEEMGMAASEATSELLRRIEAGEPLTARPHNLLGQATPFVGREEELRSIAARLADPHCRLLNVVGMGGMGKTRLAMQAAGEAIGAYPDGVFFVALAGLTTADQAVVAVAQALGLLLPDEAGAKGRLSGHLADKEMLLVLDGLEGLPGAASLLQELLAKAQALTLLVTSRESLDLAQEWIFPLDGMALAEAEAEEELERSGSARLFLQTAQRVQPGFSLRQGHAAAVAKVCRLVAGVPLAIELAASWVQLLDPERIAEAIEADLDFLRSTRGDVPQRHQSLRVVFEASWARLAGQEQELLLRLAAFPGRFGLEAACAVAETPPERLLGLLRRAMVRRTPQGSFEMHELLRQYVAEKLAAQPAMRAEAEARHRLHFAAYVAGWPNGAEPHRAMEAMGEALADLHAAWRASLQAGDWGAIEAMATGMSDFHDLRGMSTGYLELLDQALLAWEAGPGPERLLGKLLAQRAACLQRTGAYEASEQEVKRSLAILDAHPPSYERTVALRARGNAAYLRSDLQAAREAFEEALAQAEALGHRRSAAGCLGNLGLVEKAAGNMVGALQHLEEARRLAEASDEAVLSQVLNNLATVHLRMGALEEAESLLRRSVALKRALGDSRGLASNYTNLGILSARAGDYPQSERYHLESLQVAQAIGDTSGVARGHTNLAELALLREDLLKARLGFQRSLAIKRALGEQGGVVDAYAKLMICHQRSGSLTEAEAVAADGLSYALASEKTALLQAMIVPCLELLAARGHPSQAETTGSSAAADSDPAMVARHLLEFFGGAGPAAGPLS